MHAGIILQFLGDLLHDDDVADGDPSAGLQPTENFTIDPGLAGGHVDDAVGNAHIKGVIRSREILKLTQTEYNIVIFLSEHCGKMMTYAAIIKAVWRELPDESAVKKLQVNMANIRKKFGAKPGEASYIVNELGIGYRMKG